MHLSLTCFGSLPQQLHDLEAEARELGFSGVQPVPGETPEELPQGALAEGFAWIPSSLLRAESAAASASPRFGLAELGAALRTIGRGQVKGLVLEAGLLASAALHQRAALLLENLRAEGRPPAADELWEALRADAERAAEQQLEELARGLHALAQAFPGLALALAVEEGPAAILNPARLRLLREEAGLPRLAYWHDTGRAQTRAALGLDQPGDWLDAHGAIAVGCTLHDWTEGRDLCLPGEGEVDFGLVAEYLPRTSLRVLSVAPSYPKGHLHAGREALAAAGL